MKVTFWGTRGSTPCPGNEYSTYGGNTSCISVETSDAELIIDAGTGIRGLGNARLGMSKEFHIALSHFHYDHILGLPFFKPIWDPKTTLNFYTSLCQNETDFRKILQSFFADPFLPMALEDIPATLKFHPLIDEKAHNFIANTAVSSFPLEHPGGASGYSVVSGGKKFAYVSDHESNQESHERLVTLLEGYDLMVFDGFFCNENYQKGWGHSTWEYGLKLAKSAKIKKIAIFHHHVDHDDKDLTKFEKQATEEFPGAFFAREGTTITV